MADFLNAYSIQNWLESCPQGYLEDTVYGHESTESEPDVLMDNDVLRQDAIRTTVALVVGERCALAASSGLINAAPDEASKRFLATQTLDEARHVEVYHRYLTEKLGLSYEIHPSLNTLLEDICSDSRWDVTYLGMQIMVEGLALAAFGIMRLMMEGAPLIQDITSRVMADESRHVAFGVLSWLVSMVSAIRVALPSSTSLSEP